MKKIKAIRILGSGLSEGTIVTMYETIEEVFCAGLKLTNSVIESHRNRIEDGSRFGYVEIGNNWAVNVSDCDSFEIIEEEEKPSIEDIKLIRQATIAGIDEIDTQIVGVVTEIEQLQEEIDSRKSLIKDLEGAVDEGLIIVEEIDVALRGNPLDKFLMEQGIYDIFRRNLLKLDGVYSSTERLFEATKERSFMFAFSWKKTPEGKQFWNNIDDKFRIFINH